MYLCRSRMMDVEDLKEVISAQTPIAEIRQRGRYVRPVPWDPDSVIEILWSPPTAPFPGPCSGCLFRSRNWPESHDVRRHRSSLLAWSFWQISCLLRLGLLGSLWDCEGRIGVWGVSAISSPNRTATSLSSSTFAAPGAVVSGESCPALASISVSSTSRSTKRS